MHSAPLPARLDPRVSDFLENQNEAIFQMTEVFGSPIHIVFPQLLKENSEKLRSVLQNQGLASNIYFASKVNKANSFLEEAAQSGIGVDASSLQELQTALSHGINGSQISISGPSKNERLLALGAMQECTISIDSVAELETLFSVLDKTNTANAQVLLRLAGLNDAFTRFGILPNEISPVLEKLKKSRASLRGFHFHLSGYSTEERAVALQKAIHEIQRARSMGYECNTINIGGGFAVRYVDAKDWQNFLSNKTAETFAGSKDRGPYYPYGSELEAYEQLGVILNSQASTHGRVADLLKAEGVHLAIEPGRSLVDQAGITCVQVKGVKRASNNTYIIEVDANINHLSEQWFGSEYCVDPIHLSNNEVVDALPLEAAIGGNTCLEVDMLTWRKVGFSTTPRTGDILVYPNTAGYQMDSNESSFHQLPIPEKIAAFKKGDIWKWKKDSEYSFLDTK